MLLNIGTILSTGTAFLLINLSLQANSRNWLTASGATLITSLKISLIKPLLTLDRDGLGLPNKTEKLLSSIHQMLEILWLMAINPSLLLMSGSTLTMLITETLEEPIFRISLDLSTGISSAITGTVRKLTLNSDRQKHYYLNKRLNFDFWLWALSIQTKPYELNILLVKLQIDKIRAYRAFSKEAIWDPTSDSWITSSSIVRREEQISNNIKSNRYWKNIFLTSSSHCLAKKK